MKFRLKILALAATAATTFSLISCAGPASFSYQNVSIALTAYCSDCAGGGQYGLINIMYNPAYPQPPAAGNVLMMPATSQGGTTVFTANVTNAPATNVTWTIYPQPNLTGIDTLPNGTSTPVGESGSSVGSFNTPGSSPTTAFGPTAIYTQGGVNVYSGQALAQAQAMGIPQGFVMIVASLPADPDTGAVVSTNQLIQIYGGSTAQGPPSAYLTPSTPATPAGLTNPVVSVAHNPNLPTIATNGQYQFYGGIVGAAPCNTIGTCNINGVQYPLLTTDNTATWEVGPAPFSLTTAFVCTTPGLACPFGTVSQTGLYTAPATIPSAGLTPSSEVVVVLVSQLVSTVDKYAYVLLY
ncbi:MAG: hypothetical protein ABSG84_07865 [Acidobacteriaceae bacterium]|jgi:hypothetical protein